MTFWYLSHMHKSLYGQLPSKAKGLNFGPSFNLYPYFVYQSKESSPEPLLFADAIRIEISCTGLTYEFIDPVKPNFFSLTIVRLNKLMSYSLYFLASSFAWYCYINNYGRDNFWVRNLLNHLPKISLKPGQWETLRQLHWTSHWEVQGTKIPLVCW